MKIFWCLHRKISDLWTLCIKRWTISSLVRDNSLPELYWPAKYLKRFSTHCKFTFFIWKNFKLVIFWGWNCLTFLNLSFVCYSWMLFGLILSLYVKANSIQWVRSRAKLVTKRQEKTSSLPELFCKKGVHRNFPKFTGKHLCLFFIKVIKEEALAQVFSCEFCGILKNIFSYRTPQVANSEKIFELCKY